MQRIAALASEKARRHRIQLTTRLYVSLRFMARSSANFFTTTIPSWSMPPPVVKTRGMKEPCSTSLIRSQSSILLRLPPHYRYHGRWTHQTTRSSQLPLPWFSPAASQPVSCCSSAITTALNGAPGFRSTSSAAVLSL